MQGYKAVKDFTYSECQEFLSKNASSLYAEEVSERLISLEKADHALFASAKTISDYENYLKEYPKKGYPGLHREEACRKIDTLFFYQNKNTKTGCQNYLVRFPRGIYSSDASGLIQRYDRSRNIRIVLTVFFLIAVAGIICYVGFYHPASYLAVSGQEKVSQYGENIILNISSDAKSGAIYVTTDERWITVNDLFDSKVDISIAQNDSSERIGYITIRAYTTFFGNHISHINKKIKISQLSGQATKMILDTSALNYDKWGVAKGKSSFTVQCDGVAQDVFSDKNWIKVEKSTRSTSGCSIYSVVVEKNDSDWRSGKIIVKSKPHQKIITICQESGLASKFSIDTHNIVCEKASGLAKGYHYLVKITTDGVSWSASGPGWVKLTQYTSSLGIVPLANDGEVKTGTIYVRSNNNHTETISIKQNGEPSNLSVSPSSTWHPGVSSTSKSFSISNDSYYRVSANSRVGWLSVSVSGNNVKVYCDENPTSPRCGIVDIQCGNSTCTITVKQDGYKDCSSCGGDGKCHSVFTGPWGNHSWPETEYVGMQYRYEMGMWGKWPTYETVTKYCPFCRGSRKCPTCDGKGKRIVSY